jgi:hypothetical protein
MAYCDDVDRTYCICHLGKDFQVFLSTRSTKLTIALMGMSSHGNEAAQHSFVDCVWERICGRDVTA